MKLKWPWFLLAAFVIALDQGTKLWASSVLIPNDPEIITSMFNLTLAYNSGAAFSFLHDLGPSLRWIFAGFSFCMSIILVVGILKTEVIQRSQLIALSLILGGALGNFIDRVGQGVVTDFIEVHYHQYHWPVFNIADSAICIGTLLLVMIWSFEKKR